MKIFVVKSSEQKFGGGFSFVDNFKKGMGDLITDNYDEANVYFIPSPTLAERSEVEKAKQDGKKIVLRLDNVVKNSRNRGTGMPRMKDFSQWADLLVYQSKWARGLLMPFTGRDGAVILNGTDLDLFNSRGRKTKEADDKNLIYAYIRYNRDESKNWNVAAHEYSKIQIKNPDAKFWIIGNFSPELVEYNFDFYMDEKFRFFGVQGREQIADLYRQIDYLIYTYWNDACSNTAIEALVSGVEIIGGYYMQTGGMPEIMEKFQENGSSYFSLDRVCSEYKSAMENL